jgi:hypothetical protein
MYVFPKVNVGLLVLILERKFLEMFVHKYLTNIT